MKTTEEWEDYTQATEGTIFLSDADLIDEKAQRILDLIAERDRLREALEDIAKVEGQHTFREGSTAYRMMMIARAALAGQEVKR